MGGYVQVEPGVKIFVEDLNPEGEKTILFIHGWPGDHRLFEYQFDQLPKLGYRCVGVDTRGFGNSDKPWKGYDYDRLADDIRCVVEALDLQNFTLGGHSTGGAIAIRYMARYKDTVFPSLPFLLPQLQVSFNVPIFLTVCKEKL